MRMRFALAVAALTLVPAAAFAQNNTAGAAKNIMFGSTSQDFIGAAPNDQNWFRFQVKAGRSYCVEVDNGETDVSVRDPFVSVFRSNGTTLIGSNEDIGDEPDASLLSRVCYISGFTEDNLANVIDSPITIGTPGNFRIRVVDTTVFSPWFFSGSGFEAFILIKNTTDTPRSATVTLYNTAGTVTGTPQTGTVPVNGSFNLQVSATPPTGFGLASASGGVQIAHTGPPGALIANVTSLSFGSGVSFDTPASPRQDFR